MRSETKRVITLVSGAAALVLTVGFGVGGTLPGGTSTPTVMGPSSSVAPAPPESVAPGTTAAGEPSDQGPAPDIDVGCIVGADC